MKTNQVQVGAVIAPFGIVQGPHKGVQEFTDPNEEKRILDRAIIRTPHEFGNPNRSPKGKSVPVCKKIQARKSSDNNPKSLRGWLRVVNEPLP